MSVMTMAPQVMTSSYSSRPQNYKMSIAFLAGEDRQSIDNQYSTSNFRSTSLHSDPRVPRLPRILPQASWFTYDHSSPTSAKLPNFSSAFNSINSPVKRHDSLWDTESTSSISSSSSSVSSSVGQLNAETLARIPRPARPSYSEEQKFFIMFFRVMKELSWPEIEDRFAHYFNLRTKDGLTSVYYRIRKSWGMEEVLKTGPDGTMSDRRKVEKKAAHFSHEFLGSIGYLE